MASEQMSTTIAHIDSPLPDAEELAKLKKIDPKLVDCLLVNVSKEQDFRHQTHLRQIAEAEREGKSARRLNGWGMFCAFVIFTGGMALSAFMLHLGHKITGSVFAGFTLIAGAAIFLNRTSAADVAKAAKNGSEPPAG